MAVRDEHGHPNHNPYSAGRHALDARTFVAFLNWNSIANFFGTSPSRAVAPEASVRCNH